MLLNQHVRPDGLGAAESVTVPVNVPVGVTAIADEPVSPTNVGIDVGLAERAKSTTERNTVADCDWVPLDPVTVTEYWPTGVNEPVDMVMEDGLDPPFDKETLVGLKVAVGPLVTIGETAAERVTMPEKALKELTVMVDVAVAPGKTVADVVALVTAKGEAVNCEVVELTIFPA